MNKEFLNPKELNPPGAYTHVVTVAGATKLVYVSGEVSYASDGSTVGKGDIRAQCEQVFTNLTNALKAAGAGWGDVVKLNVYMVGITPDALKAFREVRGRYLKPGQFPASTLVGVAKLVDDDLLLEVELVAAVDGQKKKVSARKKKKKR